MADLVPFGKYKNQPIAVLAQDKDYCEWLTGQGWVAERFPEIHTVIVNNFAEPSETPQHNALQLRFLDEGLRLKVATCVALWLRLGERAFYPGTYQPFFAACHMPVFEEQGIDVLWDVSLWCPDFSRYAGETPQGKFVSAETYYWDTISLRIAVECKPSLGDDYPAVLRFMHKIKWPKVVVTEQYAFRGGTVQQVQQLFLASKVLLLDMPGLAALPVPVCLAQADLPDAQLYYKDN